MSKQQIQWEERFETGIASVDHEHREMIDSINGFLGTIEGDVVSAEGQAVLGEIYANISSHFALEERKMRDMGYAAFDEHKADHERLLDDIRDIMDSVGTEQADILATLPARLAAWFLGHFSTHDARLHRNAAR
jgi:hemerythrin-like metal-binding protein